MGCRRGNREYHVLLSVVLFVASCKPCAGEQSEKLRAEQHERKDEPEPLPRDGYIKVIGGRCEEAEGVLPFGQDGEPWNRILDVIAREYCDAQSWCVGYMRFLGGDIPLHCHVWCGRPQFCHGAGFSPEERWISYMKVNSVQAEEVLPPHAAGAMRIECPWPYGGSLILWLGGGLSTSRNVGSDDECHVLHHRRGQPVTLYESAGAARMLHGIVSDDDEVVPFFTANVSSMPWKYSVDANEYIGETVLTGGQAWGPKEHYLSIFYLSQDSACNGRADEEWGPAEAEHALPGHVFVDDGSKDLRRRAFSPYHFTIICGGIEEANFVPQALVDAIGFAAHPLLSKELYARFQRVFFHLQDAAQPYLRMHPKVLEAWVEQLYNDPTKNSAMFFKQTFLFLMQDLFRYRYRQDPMRRASVAACALCAEQRRQTQLLEARAEEETRTGGSNMDLVSVAICVMSRRSGHELRTAIRETWGGHVTSAGSALRFFVGVASPDDVTLDDASAGDVVELGVPESYRAVTLKAFEMLEWMHMAFPNLRFLVRSDDDVYLRPGPLFAQLEQRAPVMYLWGNIDHGSTPVRNASHPHYNSEQQYPARLHPLFGDIFPPYARGHLWVMSTDLLAFVVRVWRGELTHHTDTNLSLDLADRLPHPDDPALGVTLAGLVEAENLTLNIDDRDVNLFSLNPSCNATYLNIHSRIWVVHHVNSSTMRCMWAIDSLAGDCMWKAGGCGGNMPDLCPCSMDVVEEVEEEDPEGMPFDYPRSRFNE